MSGIEKRMLFLWGIASIPLFFYSFTQVDLSLTLTSLPLVAKILLGFQYVGFFNRPLASEMYLLLLLLFLSLFVFTILRIRRKEISKSGLTKIIVVVTVSLTFSYNAFSYDIFNYIFDARIVTHYHENPYLHKALDYPGDPMLSFMRWTHRTYPYGPVWLVLTVPLSFMGLGFFLPTFFLFKILAAGSYLLSVLFVYRLAMLLKKEKALLLTALFALNPLVIIESLVSAHLDIVMTMFMLGSIYFLFSKKNLKSHIFLIVSIGIKYATGFLAPLFLLIKFTRPVFFELAVLLLAVSVIAQVMRSNFQPWYILTCLPLIAFTRVRRPLVVILIFSTASLLQYLPPIFYGHWNTPVPAQLNIIMITSIVLGLLYLLFEIVEYFGMMKKRSV